jgi:heme-degrading monooxygenase HmoA
MAYVTPGRFTAQTDQPFVVFLIGMRVNKLLAFRKWVPTALAMGPMLRELYANPEKGFLGAHFYRSGRTVLTVQYWRSFEDLERFARSDADPHLPAWRRFNKAVGYKDGAVGVFHESYLVEPGKYETVYDNMPVFGLAAATTRVPARGRLDTARRRLAAAGEHAAPVEA